MFLCEYFLLFYSVNSVTAVNIHFSNHKGSSGYGNKNNLSVNDSIKIATIHFFLEWYLGISWILMYREELWYICMSLKN